MFSAGQNMGSLLGVAWLGTYVADQQRVHLGRMVETITLGDPQVVARAGRAAAAHAGVVVDPLVQRALGVASLAQQAAREAWVLAYADLFRRVALVAALTCVCLAAYWTAQWWRARAAPAPAALSGALP
jgi:hypothetical protein